MNLIPFFAIFSIALITISFRLTSFQKRAELEYFCFSGYLKAEREVRNLDQKNRYSAKKAKTSKKDSQGKGPGKKETQKKPTQKPTFREKEAGTDSAKLNIHCLFNPSDPQKKEVQQIFKYLLKESYGALFSKPKELDAFIKILIKAGIKKSEEQKKDTAPPPLTLYDLTPQDPKAQELYYKMLRGTRLYSLSEKVGYPPLEDIVLIGAKTRKPILFPSAAPILLKALWGEKITQKILEKEKEIKRAEPRKKKTSLSKEALEELLTTSSKKEAMLENLLDFSTPKAAAHKKIAAEEPKSHIRSFRKN